MKEHREMHAVRRGEEGVALVTALLVMMVVTTLGLVSVGLSAHSGDQSGRDRRRLQSVDAAEAGLNHAVAALEVNAGGALPCGPGTPVELKAKDATTVTFTATVTYYATYPATGAALPCPVNPATPPRAAHIVSQGRTGGQTPRTMEMVARLTPVYGALNYAVYSNSDLVTLNSFEIEGHNGNDGDVYTSGSWTCGNSPVVYGSVYAQGSILMEGSCTVMGDVWANGPLTLANSANAGGSGTSSTDAISLSSNAGYRIQGKAVAGKTVDRPEKVRLGVVQNKKSPPPPANPMPAKPWDPTEWTSKGYSIHTFGGVSACTAAKAFLATLGATPVKSVVRITEPCELRWSASDTLVRFGTDAAIVTDGRVTIEQTVEFRGTPPPFTARPLLEIRVPTGTSCAGGNGTVAISNNTRYVNLDVGIFTPCTIDAQNYTRLHGQLIGGRVLIGNNFKMRYVPVLNSGSVNLTGNRVEVAYVREVNG